MQLFKKALAAIVTFVAFFAVSSNALAADDERELYIDPTFGLWSVTEQNQLNPTIRTGLAVGFTYPVGETWNGRSRVEGMWLQAADGTGRDVRAGTFIGWRNAAGGFEIGLDLIQNRYDLRDLKLHDSMGLEVPVRVFLGPEFVHGIVGISPALLQHAERRVDWSQAQLPVGFGHEFGWQVGVGSQIRKTRVAVVYSQRQVSGDVIEGLNVMVGR